MPVSEVKRGVLRRLFSKLPFAKPYIPPGFPYRELLRKAMKRPVDMELMKNKIKSKYFSKGPIVIEKISLGVERLMTTRSGRRDASNFFTAALRAFCESNPELGLQFGDRFIDKIPDPRALRTMITINNRLSNHERSIELLLLLKDSPWVNDMKSSLKFKLHGAAPKTEESEFGSRWLYEHNHLVPLTRELYLLQYPLEIGEFVTNSGKPRIEIRGELISEVEQPENAALACFKFYDVDEDEIIDGNPLGLIFSSRVGWYSYLYRKGQDSGFSFEFEAPVGARRIVIGFRAWNLNGDLYLGKNIELKSSSMQTVSTELTKFAERARNSGSDRIVFMFSGTTYVQLVRANRPIRLTHVLLERKIPVIFNYHRSNMNEERPDDDDDYLIQIPTDITQSILGQIATLDFGIMKKMFIVSYPHPSIPKILYRFMANGWFTLYDARDEWEEFNKVGQARWYNEANERYITANCEHVTAVSRPLANKLDGYHPINPVEVVPNALGKGFLQPDYEWKGDDVVIIGYFGHLTSSWFDWDSILHIARERPDYRFELIGHSAPDDLDLPSNVELMGPKNHPEINEIAARWSVGVIPFKINALADAVDPIKIYEYLALGIPTVSFRMPQIDDYPFTKTVENIDDFISALDEMSTIKPNSTEVNNWLSINRWEDRVDKMFSMIDSTPESDIRILEALS